MLLAAPSGWSSDRIGSRLLCSAGMAMMAVGLFALGRLGPDPSIMGLTLAIVTMAIGSAAFGTPNTSAIMGSVPHDRLGTASGMAATGRQVGQAVGMAIAGSVLAYRQAYWLGRPSPGGPVPEPLAMVNGFADAAGVGALLAAMGAATSLVRGPRPVEEKA